MKKYPWVSYTCPNCRENECKINTNNFNGNISCGKCGMPLIPVHLLDNKQEQKECVCHLQKIEPEEALDTLNKALEKTGYKFDIRNTKIDFDGKTFTINGFPQPLQDKEGEK